MMDDCGPNQCEACGVYLDDGEAVIVRGVEPDMHGNIVLLNVCPMCAGYYDADPILTDTSKIAALAPDDTPEGSPRPIGRAWQE